MRTQNLLPIVPLLLTTTLAHPNPQTKLHILHQHTDQIDWLECSYEKSQNEFVIDIRGLNSYPQHKWAANIATDLEKACGGPKGRRTIKNNYFDDDMNHWHVLVAIPMDQKTPDGKTLNGAACAQQKVNEAKWGGNGTPPAGVGKIICGEKPPHGQKRKGDKMEKGEDKRLRGNDGNDINTKKDTKKVRFLGQRGVGDRDPDIDCLYGESAPNDYEINISGPMVPDHKWASSIIEDLDKACGGVKDKKASQPDVEGNIWHMRVDIPMGQQTPDGKILNGMDCLEQRINDAKWGGNGTPPAGKPKVKCMEKGPPFGQKRKGGNKEKGDGGKKSKGNDGKAITNPRAKSKSS